MQAQARRRMRSKALYAGLQRDGANFPVQYLGANVPQAWAAGSVFSMVQAILGLQPDAPDRTLYVDPVRVARRDLESRLRSRP